MNLLEFLTILTLSAYGFVVLALVFGPLKQSRRALKVLSGLLVLCVIMNIILLIKAINNGH